MDRAYLTPRLIGFVGLAIALASAIASVLTGEWHWFQRSGAMLVLCGAILSARELMRKEPKQLIREELAEDGISQQQLPQSTIEDRRQTVLDVLSAKFGIRMMVVGTVIWAYGDLVGDLVKKLG
jgi:hypothetical protein